MVQTPNATISPALTAARSSADTSTPAAKSAARPWFGGPNVSRHLAPLDRAVTGDLVAMIGGYYANFEERTDLKVRFEAFYVQGEDGLEVAFYHEVPARSADHAAHLVAETLFLAAQPHRVVLGFNMVEYPEFYELHTIDFADARLYVNTEWLSGRVDNEALEEIRPIVFEMAAASDLEEARNCVAKAQRYLDVVRHMLPDHLRDRTNWAVVLPDPEDFMLLGRP